MPEESFISISEASQILGVSETALRQWTDEGKIKAFVTPGGHRRYSKVELKKFVGTHRRMLGVEDLVIELEDTALLHREIDRRFLEGTVWYNNLTDESKRRLAELGRRVLDLIIKYIGEPSKRGEATELAHQVGRDFGETLAGQGLALTTSVEAFIAHRDPLLNATTHLMKRKEAFSGRVVEAIPLVTHIMDEALVALVAAHQHYRNRNQNQLNEGSSN